MLEKLYHKGNLAASLDSGLISSTPPRLVLAGTRLLQLGHVCSPCPTRLGCFSVHKGQPAQCYLYLQVSGWEDMTPFLQMDGERNQTSRETAEFSSSSGWTFLICFQGRQLLQTLQGRDWAKLGSCFAAFCPACQQISHPSGMCLTT